jgi:polyhydroxyalkanoate synthesis repressor PhaR
MDGPLLTIKRYPNRKFYNPNARQYITLEGIAGLIRHGQEVQVIDHTSGEDLTTLVLTQIILEQEKRGPGFMPRSLLTGLVQASGLTLGLVRQALGNPAEWLRQVDEEIERRIELLRQRGELSEAEAADLRAKFSFTGDFSASEAEQAALRRYLAEHDLPTRQDLEQINRQLEDLLEQLSALQASPDEPT